MVLISPKEFSGRLGDDALLCLLLRPWELLQRRWSHHGVRLPAACLPVRHDAHVVAAGKERKWQSTHAEARQHSVQYVWCILFTQKRWRDVQLIKCSVDVYYSLVCCCKRTHPAGTWGEVWLPETLRPGNHLVRALWKKQGQHIGE